MICPCCGKEMERNAELEKLIFLYQGGERVNVHKMIQLLFKEIEVARPIHNPQ